MRREKSKPVLPARTKVPMRSTGAEPFVVGKRAQKWDRTEGTALLGDLGQTTGNGRI